MKHLKRFNEAIVDWETDNIKQFYQSCLDILEHGSQPRDRFGRPAGKINFETIKRIGEENDIEVVDYDTFISELPTEQLKKDAPKKAEIPYFGLVNPVTHKARLVIQIPDLRMPNLKFLYHMLKHENVHVGQKQRKVNKNHGEYLGDIKNLKAYFSNKDEIMAFSQSISDMLMDDIPMIGKPKDIEDAFKRMQNLPLWKSIKSNVDSETLKRYRKYIYLYLEREFEK
jgi:hypothetical protein